MNPDPFDTAAQRAAVLSAWRVSPARFREDANTEEDYAHGWYRDRVVVDLAQNAADAAARVGVPGRLLLRLTADRGSPVLVVANTGSPLDAAGVLALASMRASAKRDQAGALGRFGVGFAAVRAVADEIELRSLTGAVRFSLAAVRAALADAPPALAAEVAARGDRLPVLRLPFASDAPPWPGYDTAVVLRLRDADALAAVADQLAQVDDALLLAMPALHEVVVETPDGPPRRLADVHRRWLVATAQDDLDPSATSGLRVEDRGRTHLRVVWALPCEEATRRAAPPRVVHAPTPTDEPCTVPALLVATFPLDPDRRRVGAGPALDAVVALAGRTYPALVLDALAHGVDLADLVPTGLPAGPLDAWLRGACLAALSDAPVLAAPHGPVEPGRAVVLDGPAGRDPVLVAALTPWLPTLAVAPVSAAVRALGLTAHPLADVVEALPAAPGPWPTLYDALEPYASGEGEALATLPVPLADGRTVRGARGTVLLDAGLATALAPATLRALNRWGLRVVDPACGHPLLERLGAVRATAAGLLHEAAVRTAVLDDDPLKAPGDRGPSDDDGPVHPGDPPGDGDDDADPAGRRGSPVDGSLAGLDPAAADQAHRPWRAPAADDTSGLLDPVAAAVLDLVRLALSDDPSGAGLPEALLGLVELPAADGEPTPARGLVLPGSPAHRLFDSRVLAPVATAVVDAWGAEVLVACGVRAAPVVVTVADVVAGAVAAVGPRADADADLVAENLDGWDAYLADLADRLGPGEWLGDLTAIADLDAVDPASWPAMLSEVAADRGLRAALLTPVRTAAGEAPSYTVWWLTTHLGLPAAFALPGSPLSGWLPAVPDLLRDVDALVARALSGVADPGALDPAGWARVLDSADPTVPVPPATAALVWAALAAGVRAGAAFDPLPMRLPALVTADRVELVDAEQVTVADTWMWTQRTDLGPLLPAGPDAAESLAAALDLPLAGELAPGVVDVPGTAEPVPAAARALLPDAPETWWQHDELTVDGVDVTWWVDTDGVHAVHLAALAAALAQVVGRWSARWAVETVLTDPDRATAAALDLGP